MTSPTRPDDAFAAGHLTPDTLEALVDPRGADPADAARRAHAAAHLAACAPCRDAFGEVRDLVLAARALPAPPLPAGLRARVLASRAAGARPLIPSAPVTLGGAEGCADEDVRAVPTVARGRTRGRAGWRRGRLALAAAAAVLAALGASLLAPRDDVQAGTTRGRLVLTPALPMPGERVEVRYHPAALLSAEPWLALRGRVRRPHDDSYNAGRPVTALARLARQADGTYAGAFTLPDSAAYAALAVEDSAAATVDDDGGRAWEVLARDPSAAGADARPSFAALNQRAHDLMGRNWEEGFATVRRMVALYPDTLAGWSWLHSHQGWLGRGADDTVRALHRAQLARFATRFTRQTPAAADLGMMAWYAHGVDTTVARRWSGRLLREAPANTFAVQWRLFDALDTLRASRDTARALTQLEAVWADAPAERRQQVAMYSASVAWEARDTAAVRRWSDREVAAAREPGPAARRVAARFAGDLRLRPEGMRRLRAELARLAGPGAAAERALDETAAAQRARHDAERRRVLAALGRALVADRAYRAGLDTLSLAAAAGWDLDVFRSVRTAALAAGDTALALTMAARVAADPRTPATYADSVRPAAERALGAAGWAERRAEARGEFVARMLAGAPTRAVAGPVRLTDAAGRRHDLAALAGGRVTVVAFTSRFCGPAIEDLPRLAATRARLERAGVRVLTVLGEPGPSPALGAFLTKVGVSGPVYFDAGHEASRAFNQWGTPNYFVLDAGGRVRFDETNSADEALARAEAVRAAAEG